MAEPPPTYTREEMDAILKRAIERQQAKAEEIGHEDLIAAAGEVGIPREDVEAAARDLAAEKAKRADDVPRASVSPARPPSALDARIPDEERALAVRRFSQRAMTFSVLSMFFVFIGHETGTGWWVWPVLGMAVSLLVQATRVFFGANVLFGVGRLQATSSSGAREPRRRHARMTREERLADFERKVAIGADALVRVIEEARNVKTRLEGEGRAAREERKERGPRVLVTPPPGVRVEPKEAETVERENAREAREARRNKAE